MDVVAIIFSFVLTLLLAVALIGLLGWRRPGAPEEEGLAASALFAFALLFFGVWAASAWVTPFGPVYYGTPVMPGLTVGLVLVLLMLVIAPPPASEGSVVYAGAPRTEAAAAAGFGVLFWVLSLALLAAAVAGSLVG